MFFRNVYGGSPSHNETRSIVDIILGHIGEPLRVDEENDEITDEGNREETMELGDIPQSVDRINLEEEGEQSANV